MDFSLQLFITHSIGFLITVWILKKYAWGPILSMLDERRNKIKGEFEKIENGLTNMKRNFAKLKTNDASKSPKRSMKAKRLPMKSKHPLTMKPGKSMKKQSPKSNRMLPKQKCS